MKIFELPISTEINRTVPKNSFDSYASAKHRKRFTELIEKIRWVNKLSLHTVNLAGKDVHEIQVFYVELRRKEDIADLLDLIDKSIPYNLIFVVHFDDSYFIRAAAKHPHPTNENIAVVDWVFQSEWIKGTSRFKLNLKTSLDFVWADFCKQLSGKLSERMAIDTLVSYEQKVSALKKAIDRLETLLKQSKQFNHKVEINMELQSKRLELEKLEAELR